MSQSQHPAPPEYTRQAPPSTPSTLLSSPSTNQSLPSSNPSSRQQHTRESQPQHLDPTSITDRPPSPTPSTTSTLLPTYAQTGSYKGFPSESAYLSALTAWAETKKYVQPSEEGQTLSGFYGCKTLEEYTDSKTEKRRRGNEKMADGGDRRDSTGQKEKQGLMAFLRKMAKKDEGGGHY